MENLKDLIKKSNNILFFTGAGVSTNCGIPDFRSSNGLYSYAKERYNLPYPEAIFDIEYFKKNNKPFFIFSKETLSSNISPSYTHRIIAKLEEVGRVAKVVTQNIDMLHEKAGSKKVLSCHGTYQTGTCRSCGKKHSYIDFKDSLLNGEAPLCSCKGIVKPDITFFGEQLPQEFYDFSQNPPQVDLVIVLGTSLEVSPANRIPLFYKDKAPLIIVNRDTTRYDSWFDYVINQNCDDFCKEYLA